MSNIQAKIFVIGFLDPITGKVKKIIKQKITEQDIGKELELKIWADFVSDGEEGKIVGTIKIPIGTIQIPQKKTPKAIFTYSPATKINVGDKINLDGSASTDEDGTIVSYLWKAENILIENPAQPQTSFVFPDKESIDITLTITDNDGLTGTKTVTIKKGEEEPTEGQLITCSVGDSKAGSEARKTLQILLMKNLIFLDF